MKMQTGTRRIHLLAMKAMPIREETVLLAQRTSSKFSEELEITGLTDILVGRCEDNDLWRRKMAKLVLNLRTRI